MTEVRKIGVVTRSSRRPTPFARQASTNDLWPVDCTSDNMQSGRSFRSFNLIEDCSCRTWLWRLTTYCLPVDLYGSWKPSALGKAIRNDGDWQAATGAGLDDGYLTLWLNGGQQAELTGIDNDTRRMDSLRLGPSIGLDSGTTGHYYIDAFESRRLTEIGL